MSEQNAVTFRERRAHPRMPLSRSVLFSWQSPEGISWGTGNMVNLNEQTICFQTQSPLRCKGAIDFRVQWPNKLQGKHPVELFIRGVPMRVDSMYNVARILTFELQITGNGKADNFPSRGSFCNVIG